MENMLSVHMNSEMGESYNSKIISAFRKPRIRSAMEMRKSRNNCKCDVKTDLDGTKDLLVIFADNKYSGFLSELKLKGINEINEISSKDVASFAMKKGNGIKKVLKIIDILCESYLLNYKKFEFVYDIFDINFWFAFPEFSDFRDMCTEKDIERVDEINEDILGDLLLGGHIKNKKLQKIKDRLSKFSFSDKINREVKIEEKFLEKIEIDSYWIEKIGHMSLYDISNMLSYPVEIDEKILLKDINGHSIRDFRICKIYDKVTKLISIINNTKSSEIVLFGIEEYITTQRERDVIKYKHKDGEKIDLISKRFSITKERVRQIENKAILRIKNYISRYNLENSLVLELGGKKVININEFYQLFNVENIYLAKLIIDCTEKYELYEPLNKVLEISLYKEFVITVDELMSKLPITINVSKDMEEILEYFNSVGICSLKEEEILKILSSYGYKAQGQYASKKKLNATSIAEMIFKDYISFPIKLDEENIAKIRKISIDKFDYEMKCNNKCFESKIRNISTIILVDKSTFIYIDNYKFDLGVLKKTKLMLDKYLQRSDLINATKLYSINECLLEKGGIKTKDAFYSLLKYYYN